MILQNSSVPGIVGFLSPIYIPFTGGIQPYPDPIDVDQDGFIDIVVGVLVYRNLGFPGPITSLSFSPSVNLPVGGSPYSIADINGDGKLDLADGRLLVENKNSPGNITVNNFLSVRIKPLGNNVNQSFDVDQDGRADFLSLDGDSIWFLLNKHEEFPLKTQPLASQYLCTGQPIKVPFTVPWGATTIDGNPTGTLYNVELSDSNGSFMTPTVLPVNNYFDGSGTIPTTVPDNIPPGTGYRIRVVSDWALTNGADMAVI